MVAAFPVRTCEFSGDVDGTETAFLLSAYADRILVFVTQLGTIGTVQSAKVNALLEGKQTYTISTLLGKRDEPALTVCARHLAQSMADAGCTRPLVLCMGLKNHSLEAMRAVIKQIMAHPVW